MSRRTILAMGGGGFSMEPDNLALDRFALSLTGKARPKVCFVPTASADSPDYLRRFYAAFSTLDCRPTHLGLWPPPAPDLRDFVLEQDLIYVGGGNTKNMLALWRAHGLDRLFEEAWEAGVVLAGLSAGALCWFESGTTDSLPGRLTSLEALGFVPGSVCVHYDGEAERRPAYQRMIAAGELPAGHGLDDGAALLFEGTAIVKAVASRPAAEAYFVERGPEGAVERRLPIERL